MNDNKLIMLHELTGRLKYVSTTDQLDDIIGKYSDDAMNGNDPHMKAILSDLRYIGEQMVRLRGMANGTGDVFSEQELAEIRETENVLDNNLLDYHFQPIVRTTDGSIYAYEALMRPRGNMPLSPFHIIKYADVADRLNDVERATFFNVLGIIDSRAEKLGEKKIFINSIPKARLSDEDTSRIHKLLSRHSSMAVVEMTEQSELDAAELDRIRASYQSMNVRTAIDDYGTGYSNVHNLLRYMPDYVKIDRSLISGIEENNKKRHFVREIIDFCHENKILAMAEGVETSDELRTLIHLGADLIQGYYTARPAPEMTDDIPYELRQEIQRYRQEREDGKRLSIYIADKFDRIPVGRMSREDYRCILIGKNGNSDVIITGSPETDAPVYVDVAGGFEGCITLNNAVLSNIKGRPCINIGENCNVKLVLSGASHLKKGGIRVPESSKLTVCGDGTLNITADGNCAYAIGNDLNSTHGELVFEQGVNIDLSSSDGIGIGSGLGGKITIIRGQFIIGMTGYRGVAIGAYFADTELDLYACDITADLHFEVCTAIGSLDGTCRAYIHHCSVKIYLSGRHLVGIGTHSEKKACIAVMEANVICDIMGKRCSAFAALEGSTDFRLDRAGINITVEGDEAFAIGGFGPKTKVSLIDADTSVRLVTKEKIQDHINTEDVVISGGRARFRINGEEYVI